MDGPHHREALGGATVGVGLTWATRPRIAAQLPIFAGRSVLLGGLLRRDGGRGLPRRWPALSCSASELRDAVRLVAGDDDLVAGADPARGSGSPAPGCRRGAASTTPELIAAFSHWSSSLRSHGSDCARSVSSTSRKLSSAAQELVQVDRVGPRAQVVAGRPGPRPAACSPPPLLRSWASSHASAGGSARPARSASRRQVLQQRAGGADAGGRRQVLGGRKQRHLDQLARAALGLRLELAEALDLLVQQLQADRERVRRGPDVQEPAADGELAGGSTIGTRS